MGMSLRDTDAHPTWPPDRTHGMCARVSSTNCINELYQRSSCTSHPADGFLVCISKRRHRPRRRTNISTTPCLKELAAWRHTVLPRRLKLEQALLSPVRRFRTLRATSGWITDSPSWILRATPLPLDSNLNDIGVRPIHFGTIANSIRPWLQSLPTRRPPARELSLLLAFSSQAAASYGS